MVAWRQALKEKWADLRFGEVKVETVGEQHHFHAHVFLGEIDPAAVRVELFADGRDGGGATCVEMSRVPAPAESGNSHTYRASVPATRPAGDYTPRILPHFPSVSVPLEASQILWQR